MNIIPILFGFLLMVDSKNVLASTPLQPLREFSTDNGGVVNTPYTIDAGHFQFETELVNYFKKQTRTSDSSGNVSTTEEENWILNNMVFRIGLTHDMDIEIGYVSYLSN